MAFFPCLHEAFREGSYEITGKRKEETLTEVHAFKKNNHVISVS